MAFRAPADRSAIEHEDVSKRQFSGGVVTGPVGVGVAFDDQVSSLFSPVSKSCIPRGLQVLQNCFDGFGVFVAIGDRAMSCSPTKI